MQPQELKHNVCKLCLNCTICEVIEGVLKEVLEGVLHNLNFKGEDEYFVCNACSAKVFAAFHFKSACMATEDIMLSYVRSSIESVIDLKKVFLKLNGNINSTDVLENQQICRLCIQLVTSGVVSLNDVNVDVINTYIPQINVNATKDPVICKLCFDSLHTHSSFLRNCRDAQGKYNNVDRQLCAKIKPVEIKPERDQEEYEHVNTFDIKTEVGEIKREEYCQVSQENCTSVDKHIKFEEVQIKTERDLDGDLPPYNLDSKTNENKKMCIAENKHEIGNEYMPKYETEAPKVKCETPLDLRSSNTEYKSEIASVKPEAASESKQFTCNVCGYETNLEKNFSCHQLIHKDPSQMPWHKCDTCAYVTKYRNHLRMHQLSHKDISEIRMHKCDVCTYESKYKSHLKVHQLRHKDPSEVPMHQCELCSYKSKHKHNLKYHMLSHKEVREVEIYKCGTCPYETKVKRCLKLHKLSHEHASETEVYQCDMCNYVTTVKNNLKYHQLLHKESPDTKMYECDKCGLKTKFKSNLKKHLLMHKDPSEYEMYKCDECPFESKYKRRVKHHKVVHRKPSEVQMYKCPTCNMETKYKCVLTRHQLKHKKP